MSIDHDRGYKLLFSHPRLVRDLLVEFVPVARSETLNLASLQRVNGSYVSDSGETRHGDVVWKVRLADQWLYIYLLLEFQSESDTWMALRIQVYVGLLYQDLVRQRELSQDGKLPPVLPVVLYNGATRWRAATDLAELLSAAPPNIQFLQPAQRYLLIDEGEFDAEGLDAKTNLAAALFRLERSRAEDMQPLLLRLTEWLAAPEDIPLRRAFATFVVWLLRRKVKDTTIPDMKDLPEVQNMLAERRLDWWEEWMREGEAKGLKKGLEKGRIEGEARLLHRLLVQRFGRLPDWVEEKLVTATEEDILRWGEGVVDARTLDQLLVR